MDLKSANQAQQTSTPGKKNSISGGEMPASGFGGLSKRNQARKPVIAAVNGFALGTALVTMKNSRPDSTPHFFF
jgi:enoyl-CoA hydratase/carnithine racemase